MDEQEYTVPDIPCDKCDQMMKFVGIQYHWVTAAVSTPDENYPGGAKVTDERVNAPYSTWKCPNGHTWTDGY